MKNKLLYFGVVGALFALGAYILFPGYVSALKFAITGVLLGYSDGREQACLDYVKAYAKQGNPSEVLNAIDKFGWNEQFLMNVGDAKGEILTKALLDKSPVNALEIGAYVGYSAVRTASGLAEGAHLTSVEFSSYNAGIARQMVAYAGLSSKVTIIEGTVTTVLKDYVTANGIAKFDFAFVDHEKSQYLPDLQYLVRENLLETGAVVVGDNILFPGAPDYREYVNKSPLFDTVEFMSHVEYLDIPDMVTVSVYKG